MLMGMMWFNAASIYLFYIFPKLSSHIMDSLIIFFPAFGYLDQIRIIISTKSVANFKIGTSLVTIAANLLRVVYWLGAKFHVSLLYQSVFMALTHIILMFLYFKYSITVANEKTSPSFNRNYKFSCKINIMHADSFEQFIYSLAVIMILITGLCYLLSIFLSQKLVFDAVGVVSNVFESFITFPQFILIVIKREIQYVTDVLIIQFLAAALCKAVIYLARSVPWIFMLGLLLQ